MTDKAATHSTALILQPSGDWCYFARESNLQAPDKPHVSGWAHTWMFSEAEPINTPQDSSQWFGRHTNPVLLFQALKQKNSWRCLMLYLHRNVP